MTFKEIHKKVTHLTNPNASFFTEEFAREAYQDLKRRLFDVQVAKTTDKFEEELIKNATKRYFKENRK